MTDRLPVTLRALARSDVDEAIGWYRDHAGADAALSFVDSFEMALAHLGRHPRTGSPRYANELGLPRLRAWRLEGFPYLVFHVERSGRLDVWRVLHAHRDIPESLSNEPEPE